MKVIDIKYSLSENTHDIIFFEALHEGPFSYVLRNSATGFHLVLEIGLGTWNENVRTIEISASHSLSIHQTIHLTMCKVATMC